MLLLALFRALPASGDTCTLTGTGTWHGSPPCAGTATLSCGVAACSADATFLIQGAISVDAALGAPDAPLEGSIQVQAGGSLSIAPGVDVHHAGLLVYKDGSDGLLQGQVLAGFEAPETQFPDSTRVRFDLSSRVDTDGDGSDETPLPWSLCDPTGPGVTCGPDTLHPADTDPGEEFPPTFLYVEWEKASPAPALFPPRGTPLHTRAVYSPGQWFPVVAVSDTSGGGVLDTLDVRLPALGPNFGHHYFGADHKVSPDGRGRCPQCIDDGTGAPGSVSNPGGHLRNAVGEPQWTLDADVPFRRAVNEYGQERWELLLDEDAADVNGRPAFRDDREFEGFLACVPSDQTGYDPASETWCARIIRSFADAHDESNGDGTPEGELFVVWNDPTGHLAPGDRLNVYYARPSAGDLLVPVNPIAFHGHRSGLVRFDEGSDVGRSQPVRGLWLDAPGPDQAGYSALLIEDFFDFQADLVLIEHQGGDGAGAFEGVGITANMNQDQEFRDSRITRLTYRYPDGLCFSLDANDDNRFCARGIGTRTGDVGWRGVGLRKLRLENAATGLGNSALDRAVDCPDGLFGQDILALHSRTVKSQDFGGQNEELLEMRGEERDCGYDRVALVGDTGGSATILRCAGCDDGVTKHLSSLVAFGTLDAAHAVTGNNDASDHVRLVNWVSDGRLASSMTPIYGARMDYFPAGAALVGWSRCNSNIGMYAVGSPSGRDILFLCGDRPPGRAVEVLDLYLRNLGGSGWDNLLEIFTDPGVPSLDLTWRNNLTHFRADAPHQRLLRARNLTQVHVVFEDSALLTSLRDGSELVRFEPGFRGTLALGPNVYTDDAAALAETGSIFQDGSHARVGDAHAPGGDGASTGWTRGVGVRGATPGEGALRLAPGQSGEPMPPGCAGGACDREQAMPRWSGPVAYDWPFAWATLSPVPGFRRTSPRLEYLPAHLVARLPTECSDGLDNDGDGLADAADPGCDAAGDISENSALLVCDDGLDDDGDGGFDFDPATFADPGQGRGDPGCAGPVGLSEQPACDDGLDNDGDGGIDWDGGGPGAPGGPGPPDAGCQGNPRRTSESAQGPRCGLGFEVALLLLLARWVRPGFARRPA